MASGSAVEEIGCNALKTLHSALFAGFIYLFILHSMHAAIKAMAVNRHIVKDVNT